MDFRVFVCWVRIQGLGCRVVGLRFACFFFWVIPEFRGLGLCFAIGLGGGGSGFRFRVDFA